MSLATISILAKPSGSLISSLRCLSLCTKLQNPAAPEIKMPKKPATPWIRFFAANLSKAKEVQPNTKNAEIMKKLSSKWKLMSENEKSPFVMAYEKEKEMYKLNVSRIPEKDLAEASKVKSQENAKKRAAKLKNKAQAELNKLLIELEKPSRPLGAYTLYVLKRSAQIKAASGHKDPKDVIKELGAEWTKMEDQQKLPYARDAIAASEKYKEDMAVWTSRMGKLGKLEVIMEAEKKLAVAKKNVKEIENKE